MIEVKFQANKKIKFKDDLRSLLLAQETDWRYRDLRQIQARKPSALLKH